MLRKESKQYQKTQLKSQKAGKKIGRQKIGTKKRATNQKLTNMVDINPATLIITLNINGLNAPIKRQRL